MAVNLDGGSRFHERESVKFAFAEIFMTCLRMFGLRSPCPREKNQHLTTVHPLARRRPNPASALRRHLFREHAPSENHSVASATQREHADVHSSRFFYVTA